MSTTSASSGHRAHQGSTKSGTFGAPLGPPTRYLLGGFFRNGTMSLSGRTSGRGKDNNEPDSTYRSLFEYTNAHTLPLLSAPSGDLRSQAQRQMEESMLSSHFASEGEMTGQSLDQRSQTIAMNQTIYSMSVRIGEGIHLPALHPQLGLIAADMERLENLPKSEQDCVIRLYQEIFRWLRSIEMTGSARLMDALRMIKDGMMNISFQAPGFEGAQQAAPQQRYGREAAACAFFEHATGRAWESRDLRRVRSAASVFPLDGGDKDAQQRIGHAIELVEENFGPTADNSPLNQRRSGIIASAKEYQGLFESVCRSRFGPQ